MPSRQLEFRGISRKHLGMYFEELGGELQNDSFPYLYKRLGWFGAILNEAEISITSTFKVTSVQVQFCADDEFLLEDLIKKYRYKTNRVGG